jgi:hypothetical protein
MELTTLRHGGAWRESRSEPGGFSLFFASSSRAASAQVPTTFACPSSKPTPHPL